MPASLPAIFLPSPRLQRNTSMKPPAPCTVMLLAPTSTTWPIFLPRTAPKVAAVIFLASKICSFSPFTVVHAPGAGLQPRMML